MTRRWLNSADVEIDDASGALLVKVGDAELKVDMATVDVSAIVDGIAGASPNTATLSAISGQIGAATATPLNDSTTKEDTTARAGISLWKRMVNVLIDVLAALVSAAQTSSGTIAAATTSDAAVELIAADAVHTYHNFCFNNSGVAAGFFSVDGGTTWHYLPASGSVPRHGWKIANKSIQIQRVAGGSNLTGVYVSLW